MKKHFTKYLVGGAVRDQLLGRPVTERDWVVVGATPEMMQEAGFRPVGQDFPVFLEPGSGEEYALARTERKSGRGYGGFTFHTSPDVTIEEDLVRRDLTVNAMAQAEDGTLIDPYGGQQDLEARLLRHVSPAFAEDPLRVLRVARFAARYAGLGFTVAEETRELMRQLATSGELEALTAERSWKEISRALMEPSPEVFVQVLYECDALEALFPELNRLFDSSLSESHGNLGSRLLNRLRVAARMDMPLAGRWACLLLDAGRDSPAESSAHALIQRINQRCKAPRDCQELALLASDHLSSVHNGPALAPEALAQLFKSVDIYRRPERFEQLLSVGEADAAALTSPDMPVYPQAEYLHEAADTARQVSIQPLLEKGLQGAELGAALERERSRALAAYQQAFINSSKAKS
ncbi:multifunctional CCA addition/repair protein [Pseudomonas sp. gcc21]|uniref:multifunctional CCA addition/repair protein n=1 Tax=Pseudomonas sp. gcc21 TaxID=2726989 RepID=UPI001451F697|nr:multifunctional CCA addition/repair protein [Pseudomonas sp. gcc21]QJD59413.1 multifunctional CCA addition/repair protein [Pseudomonas sp. gcc21]